MISYFKWTLVVISTLVLCTGPAELPAQARPLSRETPVVRAVRLAGPAVVNISTRQIVSRGPSPFHSFRGNDLFENFFKEFFEQYGRQEMTRASLGSGVIIDGRKGFILTNEHVVVKASEIKVSLVNEQEYTARLVGSDPDSDLAVLQIRTDKKLPALAMGDSDDLMIGETVIAIGNPFGLTHTVTTGVISAINRSVKAGDRIFRDFIQTDASINPGNSGGPLLNINGQLIGVNTAIYDRAEGIGFAIPINKAKRIIRDLISYGEVHPAWLGLSLQTLDARLAEYFKAARGGGAVITEVDPEGPATRSGLARGDVITRLDHHQVGSVEAYEDILRGYTARARVKLTVKRQGRTMEFHVQARTFPLDKARKISWDTYGLDVLERGSSKSSKDPQRVVVSQIRPRSPAGRIGLRPGDIVHQINEIQTDSVESYLKAMAKYRFRQRLSAIVQRGKYAYHITLAP